MSHWLFIKLSVRVSPIEFEFGLVLQYSLENNEFYLINVLLNNN